MEEEQQGWRHLLGLKSSDDIFQRKCEKCFRGLNRKLSPSCKFFKTVSRKCLLHNFLLQLNIIMMMIATKSLNLAQLDKMQVTSDHCQVESISSSL